MKILKDKNGAEWEVYSLKLWSFVFLIPLLYNLIISLLQAQTANSQSLWQFSTLIIGIGVVAFLLSNADYIYAVRIKVYPSMFGNKEVTTKRTPFQIWIKK